MSKYKQLAIDIVKNIGGKENVISLTHCVTRLRFQLKDESIAQTDILKEMDGVVTVIKAAGQYQVVIGNHVPDVFKDVCAVVGIDSNSSQENVKKKRKFSEVVLDIISGIFMPSIGILCASGILKGLNVILNMTGLVDPASGLGQLLTAAADAMFYFFPIILGYNTFKKLGGTPFLGMTLGAALMYPTLQGVDLNVFGFTVNATYVNTTLPIIILSFFAIPIEKFFRKIIPDVIKNFVVPALVLLICVPIGFCIIGPASNKLGDLINIGIQNVYGLSPIIAGVLMGFLWQLLVMMGCHLLVVVPLSIALRMGIEQPLLAVIGFISFVQTGAVFAIWLKTRNKKLKSIALPAWISGIFGVTEPAIYGVTLQHGKQFILTCIGGGVIGGISTILGVTQYISGGLGIFVLPALINTSNVMSSLINIGITTAASVGIGFILAFFTFKDKKVENNKSEQSKTSIIKAKEIITSPLSGVIKPLREVEDEAFSQGVLGQGLAIDPTDGKVVSPVDGTVMTLFPTKHAIGIISDTGAEILIHLGMNTVQLQGKYFESCIKEGDRVKKGDLLMNIDIEGIKSEGYSIVTPIIITNTNDFLDIVEIASGPVKIGQEIIDCLT